MIIYQLNLTPPPLPQRVELLGNFLFLFLRRRLKIPGPTGTFCGVYCFLRLLVWAGGLEFIVVDELQLGAGVWEDILDDGCVPELLSWFCRGVLSWK